MVLTMLCRANELEELTTLGVYGVDGAGGETAAFRELHSKLSGIRAGLAGAVKLWRRAEEAADKCQVILHSPPLLPVPLVGPCISSCIFSGARITAVMIFFLEFLGFLLPRIPSGSVGKMGQ